MVVDKWKKTGHKNWSVENWKKAFFVVEVNFRIICYGNGVKSN
jgi:hypothetical protein